MVTILAMLKYLKKWPIYSMYLWPTYKQIDLYTLNPLQQSTEKGLDENTASRIRAYWAFCQRRVKRAVYGRHHIWNAQSLFKILLARTRKRTDIELVKSRSIHSTILERKAHYGVRNYLPSSQWPRPKYRQPQHQTDCTKLQSGHHWTPPSSCRRLFIAQPYHRSF